MEKAFVDLRLCSGCGACEALAGSSAITVSLDRQGLLRPVAGRRFSARERRELRAICPGKTYNFFQHQLEDSDIWGHYEEMSVVAATDEQIRFAASSGGGISAVLQYLLEEKLVDSVLHIGPSPNNPLETALLESVNREEILANCSSRYSPAAPLSQLPVLIKPQQKYAFVGKPCDVAGLRLLQRKTGKYSEIVVVLSFFCAGTPSLDATKQLIAGFGVPQPAVQSLKYRGDGWPGKFTVRTNGGEVFQKSYEESWGDVLGKQVQSRCKFCIDGIGELADIVFGDAWTSARGGYPSFQESPGRSLAISRTPLGKELIDAATKKQYLSKLGDLLESDLEAMQPYQAQRRRRLPAVLAAMKLAGRATPNYEKQLLGRLAKRSSRLQRLRTFVGTLLRMVSGRI